MALHIAQITVFEFTNTVTICDKLNFFHNNIITIKDALVYFFTSLNIVNANNPHISLLTLFQKDLLFVSTIRLDSTTIVTEPVAVSTPSPPPPVTKCNSFKFLIHNSPNFKFIFDLLKNISNMYFTNSMPCTVGSDYRICPINMYYISNKCYCCGSNIGNTLTHPIDGVYNPSTHCICSDSLYDWNNDQCIGVCSELLPSRKSHGNKNASSPGFCQNRNKDCDPNLCYNKIISSYGKIVPLSIEVTNKSNSDDKQCLTKFNIAGRNSIYYDDIGLARCNPSDCSQRFVAYRGDNFTGTSYDGYYFKYIGCDGNGLYTTENNNTEDAIHVGKYLDMENGMDDIWSGKLELKDRNLTHTKRVFIMNIDNTAYFKGDGGMDHPRKMRNLDLNNWYRWDKKTDTDNKHGTTDKEEDGSFIHFLRR
jgi:hypothetical protein